MIIPFYEETLNKSKTVNLANTDNIELTSRGLKPLLSDTFPRFFTPDGLIYYEMTRGRKTISDHYNANFRRDFYDCINAITKTNERDYIIKSPRFELVDKNKIVIDDLFEDEVRIYDNKIIYTKVHVKEALSKIPDAESQIKQLTGEELSIMELSDDDIIFGECFRNINFWKARDVKMKITAIDRMRYLMKELISHKYIFKDADCLRCQDVDGYLNYPCNLAYQYKLNSRYKGAYSSEALKIIKGLINSKIAIYNYFVELCEKSSNPLQMLNSIKELYDIDSFTDIVVMAIGLDKIESQLKNSITTSTHNINERFFNYLIMDFNIFSLPKLVPDYEKNQFKMISNDSFIKTTKDYELEEEIKYIKRLPYKERYRYMK